MRPRLGQDVLPASAVESMDEGREVMVAGWPLARQHPRGKEGTVFATIEDETGDVQLILWAKVFAMRRGELGEPGDTGPGRGVPVGRHNQHRSL